MAEHLPHSEAVTLHDQLLTVKAEVDALQIEAMRKIVPWYGNAATLIAAFALFISLGSTVFTYVRNIEQDNWALRAELRSLILRLNDLPLKNHELQQKYKKDALIAGDLAGLANNENLILSTQAAEIIAKIPQLVSGSEALTVAVALRNSNQFKASMDLLLVAEKGSNNSESMVTILRNLGVNNYRIGNPEIGRGYYQKALNIFIGGKFSTANAMYEFATHALTEMYWAQSEALIKNCGAWKEHIAKAYVQIENVMSLTPDIANVPNPIKSQIDKTASYGCTP